MTLESTITTNSHTLFGVGTKLPSGAHNSLIFVLVFVLIIWGTRIVLKFVETKRLYDLLNTQRQCLHLKGMASYVGDFQRLHRRHLTQILRIRRTVPAVVVPRIMVSAFLEKGSLKLVDCALPSEDSPTTLAAGQADDGFRHSSMGRCKSSNEAVAYLEFSFCSTPKKYTVAQLISNVSLEQLTTHITTARYQGHQVPIDSTSHYRTNGYHDPTKLPTTNFRVPPVWSTSRFNNGRLLKSSVLGSSLPHDDRHDPGTRLGAPHGFSWSPPVTLDDPQYARDPLAPLEPLIGAPSSSSSSSSSSSVAVPITTITQPSWQIPTRREEGIPLTRHLQQSAIKIGTRSEEDDARSLQETTTLPTTSIFSQTESPTDGRYRGCRIPIDHAFANAVGLFPNGITKTTSAIYLVLYTRPSVPFTEDTHVGGVPIASTFACITPIEISSNHEACSVTATHQFYSAEFIGPDPMTVLTPAVYYKTFTRLFQPQTDGRHPSPAASSSVAIGPRPPDVSGPSPIHRVRRWGGGIDQRALESFSDRARRFLGARLLRYTAATEARNLAMHRGSMLSGSLFADRAPLPIPPTPDQWKRLVYLQRPSDVYGLESDGDNLCLICMTNPKETVLLPCRHCSCCSECLKSLRQEKCPMCRGMFSSYIIFPLCSHHPPHCNTPPSDPSTTVALQERTVGHHNNQANQHDDSVVVVMDYRSMNDE